MMEPYALLGVTLNDDDATIRQRYLALIRQFTPEQHPAEFARIQAAYQQVQTLDLRVQGLLNLPKANWAEPLLQQLTAPIPPRRWTLAELRAKAQSQTSAK
ncbi:MAG: J domain-containing protein [Gemmataceae bacterium]